MTAWSQGTWKKCNYPLGQTYKVGEILWKLLYLTMKMLIWFLQTKPEKNVNPFAWANNAYTCSGCLTQHVYMYMLKLSVPDRVDTAGRAKVFYLRKEWREVGPARRVTWQAQSQLLFCMKTVLHIKYIINLRKLAFSCYNVARVRQMNILLKTNFLHINGGSVVELALLNKTTNTILFTLERWIEQYNPYACLC